MLLSGPCAWLGKEWSVPKDLMSWERASRSERRASCEIFRKRLFDTPGVAQVLPLSISRLLWL